MEIRYENSKTTSQVKNPPILHQCSELQNEAIWRNFYFFPQKIATESTLLIFRYPYLCAYI